MNARDDAAGAGESAVRDGGTGAARDALVLALDQGGQSSRALVFDARGNVVAKAARAVGEHRASDDRVEQDGEELVRSLQECVDEVARALGKAVARVRAAGLATQRSSIACWDRASGAALGPVLSWQDRRAAAALEPARSREAWIVERTGLRLSPHYGATKLAWCLENEPLVRAARARNTLALGPLASFLVHRLAQERPFVADPANASRTLLWNLARGDWDDELCALFGVPRALLPECVPTRGEFGTLAVGAERVPLTLVNGDQSCALFAGGAPDADALYANFGTGAFLQRPVSGDAPAIDGLLRSVVLGERAGRTCVVEGTINGAGSALAHHARELGVAEWERALDPWLRDVRDPPLFLNGHSGLAAPFWRSDFRSRFVADARSAGAPEALVAVAESIAFLACSIVERMDTALPRARRVLASGGLAQSDAFVQLLADMLALDVERRDEPEATARGLAWLLFDGLDPRAARFEEHAPARFAPRANSPARAHYPRWRAELERALDGRATDE
ncbi:MAG: FGGY family carbohydrate kinase [Planctomycetota bacterium]